jgi:hypothetical protein
VTALDHDTRHRDHDHDHDHDHDYRNAWLSLTLFLPSLIGAFVVGEGLLTWYGYSGEEDVPVGVALGAGLPACVVFALPALVTWFFARRALAAGRRDARWALIVAVALPALFLAQNLLSFVVGLLVDALSG